MKKHLTRLLDRIAPVRPPGADRGYRRLLRWAALPVTDRRWAAPLAALALGFGIFAGVAIGPGASGTFAGGVPQVIELPGLPAGGGEDEAGAATGEEGGGFAESGEEGGNAFPEEEASTAFEAGFPEEEAPAGPAPEPQPQPTVEEPEDQAEEKEPAQTMGGFVVHTNPAAGSYTVVEAGGLMNAIHAPRLPAPGTEVSVPVRTLANGTFAEAGRRKQTGKGTDATLAGVVTFVDPDPATPAYAVSKRGVSVLVRVRPDPAGTALALPQLGAYAVATVEIEKTQPEATPPPPTSPPPVATCAPDPAQQLAVPAAATVLWQTELEADGAPFASSDFAGVVAAVCAAEAKLSVSADDLRQAGKDIVFTVPKSIDLAGLAVGDSVAATAEIAADGGLRLTGLASDERAKGADDAAAAQGDLASQAPK